MPTQDRVNEYAATLMDFAEDRWAIFQGWLRASGYSYKEDELEALHTELRKRAGRE